MRSEQNPDRAGGQENPVLQTIAARRSARAYLSRQIPQEMEQAILQAGRAARSIFTAGLPPQTPYRKEQVV